MNDGPLFMHLLLIHLNDLLDSNCYSIALIKDDIGLVKEALEFIRSFFVNVEQGLNKHLWARVLDVAYEAYKVYNDESVCSHFNIRAWCTIDQEYDEKKLLVKIFIQDTGSDLKFSEDIDIADMLRKQLFGKRKLGVITERAFGEQSCPDELLDVGKEIVQNWKGLPLVVDLIAEVIARREKTKSVWLEVRNNLNSFILNSEVDVIKVVELSYDHLPHHVKPCFIYLASYPKESEVVRDELKMYLHAEGLVERTEMKSEEEVMDNLISSSLVSLPYKSDIPWAIWNPPLTRRGWPQPKCVARVGVSESDTP
ncbi:hypothetical protein FXO37_09322 [Capsicum annuum]|nr:hypothetical protein FXO37_09322 [Capsicum annuum]